MNVVTFTPASISTRSPWFTVFPELDRLKADLGHLFSFTPIPVASIVPNYGALTAIWTLRASDADPAKVLHSLLDAGWGYLLTKDCLIGTQAQVLIQSLYGVGGLQRADELYEKVRNEYESLGPLQRKDPDKFEMLAKFYRACLDACRAHPARSYAGPDAQAMTWDGVYNAAFEINRLHDGLISKVLESR